MSPSTDVAVLLRAELEKLTDTPNLAALFRVVLGTEPPAAGESSAAVLAGALVDECLAAGAVEALCDALAARYGAVAPALQLVRREGQRSAAGVTAGARIGEVVLEERLGSGPLGSVFRGRRGADRLRVKVLDRRVAERRTQLARHLAAARAAGSAGAPGLPSVTVSESDGLVAIAQPSFPGATLAEPSVARRFRDAWPVLRAVLATLQRLHASGLVHGSLHGGNVLVTGQTVPPVVLLDVGTHFLRPPAELPSPEQICGELPTRRSDVFAFGVLAYTLVAGKPPFPGTAAARAAACVSRAPDPASFVAPRGYVEDALDELLLEMLDRDPARRPADAEALLDRLEGIASRGGPRSPSTIPEPELDDDVAALLSRPGDEVLAGVLEATVDRGADPRRAAEAFLLAADALPDRAPQRRRLLSRAATLYENGVADGPVAVRIYERLAALDPSDESAWAAIERILRREGSYDHLAEALVSRTESTAAGPVRAHVFATLAEILETKLDDREQALVALVHAFGDAPLDSYAQEIERLAGSQAAAWAEVLATLSDHVMNAVAPAQRAPILLQLGRWYADHSGNTELSEGCFRAILDTDPSNDAALVELTALARKARRFRDLAALLQRRADGAVDPALARDLRMDAAVVHDERLGEHERALALYEQVAADDPSNVRATDALVRMHAERGDARALVEVLENAVAATAEPRRTELVLKLAHALEHTAGGDARAAALYEEALPLVADASDALAGLERTYRRLGRHEDLRRVLEETADRLPSTRQRVATLESLATLLSSDLKDPDAAAHVMERLLELSPGHPGALAGLQAAYERRGDHRALADLNERWLRSLPPGPARVEPLLALGALYEERLGLPGQAIASFEAVLDLDPRHAGALKALARLRAAQGDDLGAASAHEALAGDAPTASRRAAELMAAGQIFEQRGDLGGATDRYRRALEASPALAAASSALRRTRLARGEIEEVVRGLEVELAAATSPAARVELGVELARLLLLVRRDPEGALAVAQRVLSEDASNLSALVISGDANLTHGAAAKAAEQYSRAAARLDQLGAAEHGRVLAAHARALGEAGDAAAAVARAETVLGRFADQREAFVDAARTILRHGSPERALALSTELVERHAAALPAELRAEVLLRRGQALARLGRPDEAASALEEAARLDAGATEPLVVLKDLLAERQRWGDVREVLERLLTRATAADRPDLLAELGDVLARAPGDSGKAAARYLEALAERPGDRKLLVKLVQLYTAEHDWHELVGVILKLADVAPDDEQRARHQLVAARVVLEELRDAPRATAMVDRAVESAPSAGAVVREAVDLYRKAGETERLQHLLERQIEAAARANDRARARELATALADLHLSELHRDEAIAVYEAVDRLGAADRGIEDVLVDLYASDPPRYLERAVALEERVIARDPYRVDPYRTLLGLYTETKNRDAAFCVCQALTTLGAAATDEEAYFRKHRSSGELPPGARITEDDFQGLVSHPSTDRTLTAIFTQIQPIVARARGLSMQRAGCTEDRAVPTSDQPTVLLATLARVATALRMKPPRLYLDPESSTAIRIPRTAERCLLLGPAALGADVPRREAAFVAGSHLACLRPGAYVRTIVSTVAGLKAWMLAAIRLVAPRLAVTAELEGPTNEAFQLLQEGLSGAAREWLAQPVGELLRATRPADVGRWMAGIDLTSDRLGFIACGDLPTAVASIRASGDGATSLPVSDRVRALVAYSVSPRYLTLRERLRVTLDALDEAASAE